MKQSEYLKLDATALADLIGRGDIRPGMSAKRPLSVRPGSITMSAWKMYSEGL